MDEETHKKGTENVVFKLHKERAKLKCTGPTVSWENGNTTYLLTILFYKFLNIWKIIDKKKMTLKIDSDKN